MDWFERITGFRETSYERTQEKLREEGGYLYSSASARRYSIGTLETPTLQDLRARMPAHRSRAARSRVTCIVGGARALHAEPQYRGALFQVASQFNLLEMTGPSVTPEDGVTRYMNDPTQGPACAIAAGAGTIFRNYLVPIGNQLGQRADRQIDCLADLGEELGNTEGRLWGMRNGYALPSSEGLKLVQARLRRASSSELDRLRGLVRVGLQWDVQVTDSPDQEQLVSQAYCSALPCAYSRLPLTDWQAFSSLVLDATYEAALLAAVYNAARGGSNIVLLTQVGGGAFGNDVEWIRSAMRRAITLVMDRGLDIRIVCYRSIPADLQELAASF